MSYFDQGVHYILYIPVTIRWVVMDTMLFFVYCDSGIWYS